jgi:hypothetical protein
MRRCLALFAVALITACGSDASTAPQPTIAGTWTLQTINGSPLPFIVAQTGTNKVELVSDVVVISGTGSFTETSSVRTTTNGVATTQSVADAGSYTLNGTAVTLHFNSDGSTATGSWSGNTVTVTDVGLALVFTR